eukprot:6167552-Amphidinium_carterae.1
MEQAMIPVTVSLQLEAHRQQAGRRYWPARTSKSNRQQLLTNASTLQLRPKSLQAIFQLLRIN